MLVGVEVGHGDAGTLELPDLRECLRANIVGPEATQHGGGGKGGEGRAKACVIAAKQRGNGLRERDRHAVGEDDVAADAERGISAHDGNGIGERGPIRHEGCRAEDARTMQLFNGAIDSWSEPKVVRIDNQSSGHDLLKARQAGESVVGSEGLEPPTSCL